MEDRELSSLYGEFKEIQVEFLDRKSKLDADLLSTLKPLDNEQGLESKMHDLFTSRIYYPELSKEFNFISFDKLSNDTMKKILNEDFLVSFVEKDGRMKVYGKSKNNVEFEGFYSKPNRILDNFLNKVHNDKLSNIITPSPREENTLINSIPNKAYELLINKYLGGESDALINSIPNKSYDLLINKYLGGASDSYNMCLVDLMPRMSQLRIKLPADYVI